MRVLAIAFVVGAALAVGGRSAHAYPQFQLSHDTTCTGCHISPSGGGLLTENGLTTAETISTWGTNPAFLNGAVTTPEWLSLGGDLRGLAGYMQTPQRYLMGIPMQADFYANARKDNFSAQLTVGMRPSDDAAGRVWAREHYLMWQSEPGAREGQWIRVGHFMPVFGLRFAEHPIYTRRYGGTPLFAETYAASFSSIAEKYEFHVTGFIDNPLGDSVLRANGAAAYGEAHVIENTIVGGGVMYTQSDFEKKPRVSLTAKHYLPEPGILLQTEWQYVGPHVSGVRVAQIVGYVMATKWVGDSVMVNVGLGHYDQNTRVQSIDRDAVELNVHWFLTSHIETALITRVETVGWTYGGPSSGWAMAQLHYRL